MSLGGGTRFPESIPAGPLPLFPPCIDIYWSYSQLFTIEIVSSMKFARRPRVWHVPMTPRYSRNTWLLSGPLRPVVIDFT